MTDLQDRANAFENKYAHDEGLRFKVEMRRNKLVGEWAGALLGKEDDAMKAYIKEVIESDFDEPGDDDVLRKVLADLEAANLPYKREDVRAKMDALMGDAKTQLMNEAE